MRVMSASGQKEDKMAEADISSGTFAQLSSKLKKKRRKTELSSWLSWRNAEPNKPKNQAKINKDYSPIRFDKNSLFSDWISLSSDLIFINSGSDDQTVCGNEL